VKTRVLAQIAGRVQGVGFRPAVYRAAIAHGLTGFVRNDPYGVSLEIEGEEQVIAAFFEQLRQTPPSQAIITAVDQRVLPMQGSARFEVIDSNTVGPVAVHITPDLATCPDCLRELADPQDRRAGYPFINCTHCGPRFTIVRDLPYDRADTSMADFTMCSECGQEYHDPADRRFHAQPNACEKCGPRLEWKDGRGEGWDADASHSSTLPLVQAVSKLQAGQIVAIKSLGGYHLACTLAAVPKLRERKHRPHKPFAVMFRDIEMVKRHCEVSEAEEAELLSVARPIVILKVERASRPFAGVAMNGRDARSTISPDFPTCGVFLPYTPIHHLLLQHFDALVMTSGNLADEPIASDETELPAVADAVLSHNRPIVHKCDDSVVRVVNGQRQFFRRARGFVPAGIRFAADSASILAVGGELKNTFCLARDGWAFLSQHIGDLKEYRTSEYFTHEIAEWQRLLRVMPVAIAHDLHPDYRSTRWAEEWKHGRMEEWKHGRMEEWKHGRMEEWKTGRMEEWKNGNTQSSNLPPFQSIPVQHHHAHVVSVMAEHELQGEVIGVALDGTGYGPDGTIWGGEVLVATRAEFERVGHFKQYRLPGGEKAIQEPWRMAVSVAVAEGLEEWMIGRLEKQGQPTNHPSILPLLHAGFNSPLTSSAGRLFDAVAALLGLCDVASYEAQAAIRLEAVADPSVTGHYPFDVRITPNCHPEQGEGSRLSQQTAEILRVAQNDKLLVLDFGPTIRALVADRQGVGVIAARFHNTIVAGIVRACESVRAERGLHRVALSGGVFQNEWILTRTLAGLRTAGFAVFTNTLVPPNDGGLALGQVAVAAAKLEGEPPGEPLWNSSGRAPIGVASPSRTSSSKRGGD